MKKTSLFTKIIYLLFVICTIITFTIVYNDVDNNMATKFVIGYSVFALLMLLYIPIIALMNARKLKLGYLKKVSNKFIFLFAIMFIINCSLNYIFKANINILGAGFSALGLSFGLAFINVIFLKSYK